MVSRTVKATVVGVACMGALVSARAGVNAAQAPGVMTPGQVMFVDDTLSSADGRFQLAYQEDGNLVLSDMADPNNPQALWSSGTGDNNPGLVTLQTDGNFVIYNGDGQAEWATYTEGSTGDTLVVQSDGNLVLYTNHHTSVLWNTGTDIVSSPAAAPAPAAGASNPGSGATPESATLGPGQALTANQTISSPNGHFQLAYQDDGNLVLYDTTDPDNALPLWTSNTADNNPGVAVMQTDGNFVIYDGNGNAKWATFTDGTQGSFLTMQNDGNLVLYNGASALWNTHTNIQ